MPCGAAFSFGFPKEQKSTRCITGHHRHCAQELLAGASSDARDTSSNPEAAAGGWATGGQDDSSMQKRKAGKLGSDSKQLARAYLEVVDENQDEAITAKSSLRRRVDMSHFGPGLNDED